MYVTKNKTKRFHSASWIQIFGIEHRRTLGLFSIYIENIHSYVIIQGRQVTSGPEPRSLKWSVSQQPPLIVAIYSRQNLLLGLQLHLKSCCAICCCSQDSHINTFKAAVCPTSSVLWDEARGLKLLGKKIITLVIRVSGKWKCGESGRESRVGLGAQFKQLKDVRPQSIDWQNKKGGTLSKHQENTPDWCFPCKIHTHTDSNGLNRTAEHRQHTGKLYCIYTTMGPRQADFYCLFKMTTMSFSFICCCATPLVYDMITIWTTYTVRCITYTVHWFGCAYTQFYVGKDMRCTVYFKESLAPGGGGGDTTVMSQIVQHWAPPKKKKKRGETQSQVVTWDAFRSDA